MSHSYYAVAKGRNPGVYDNWDECKSEVHQYSRPVFKKFSSQAEAQSFVQRNSDSNTGGGYRGAEPAYGYGSGEGRSTSSYRSYDRPSSTRSAVHLDQSDYEYTAPKGKSSNYNVDKDGYVNVYTDGACASNGRDNSRAGIGVWFGDKHPMNVSRPLEGRATNNRAEIEAATEAARQAQRAGITDLKINTDSKFLENCAKDWIPKWRANGWKTANNEPVINKSELIRMQEAFAPLNVKWNHVDGHAGVHGNEQADKLAKAGCSRN